MFGMIWSGNEIGIKALASLSTGVITITLCAGFGVVQPQAKDKPEEAPTGFNNSTNGFEDQAAFDNDRRAFEEVETILSEKSHTKTESMRGKDAKPRRYSLQSSSETDEESSGGGLGPVYNATSCATCHQNPVTGSSSQVAELRAGHHKRDPHDPKKVEFIEAPGGSLIHQRAIDAQAQEQVRPEDEVRTLRMSTNILGNGFVEVIPDQEIHRIQAAQPKDMRGLAVTVPVAVAGKKTDDGEFEFDFVLRLGRFGWKCQEASLINFSAGAYLNEMGITSPLQPKENTSEGRDVSQFDQILDPEDDVDENDEDNKEHPFGDDVKAFARFMRSTKAPPRDFGISATRDVEEGEKIFESIGCAICHHPTYTTPKAGTKIIPLYKGTDLPGSDLKTVPAALGNRIIHPYSDFLLHDIGTGDGIAQTQHAQRQAKGADRIQQHVPDMPQQKETVQVQARVVENNRRALSDSPGLDQRTINMIRTAPLWGLRVRPQLMHDGLSLTLDEAIRRHKGQAVSVETRYEELSDEQKRQLIAFLRSL
jgi:CxxC motif-containing protein (DUF1111 family)